ncbi:guanine nucleotide exchange protein for ADP-robosylation factor [Dispira simplex]|nr:guanine nucleotide exchange protein for ADP-robosylation factor [Dispira simplex]
MSESTTVTTSAGQDQDPPVAESPVLKSVSPIPPATQTHREASPATTATSDEAHVETDRNVHPCGVEHLDSALASLRPDEVPVNTTQMGQSNFPSNQIIADPDNITTQDETVTTISDQNNVESSVKPATERDEPISPSLVVETSAPVPAIRSDSLPSTTQPTQPSRAHRTNSTSTVGTATNMSATSSFASVHFFIVNDLEKLLKTREGKRDKQLRDALTQALDGLKQHQPQPMSPQELPTVQPTIAPPSATLMSLIVTPLRLACAMDNPQVTTIALDCIEKLISYRFFEYCVHEPVPPAGQTQPAHKPGESILDQLVTIICQYCAGEMAHETVQLQIVKALLAAVSCTSADPKHCLHQDPLLVAVRTIYNIFLMARSEPIQVLAQGALAQIVHLVFNRVQVSAPPEGSTELAYLVKQNDLLPQLPNGTVLDSVPPMQNPTTSLFAADGVKGHTNDVLQSPSRPASTSSTPALSARELPTESPAPSPRMPPASPTAMSQSTTAGVTLNRHSVSNQSAGQGTSVDNDQAIRDAFALFRALCKLSTKAMNNEQYNDIRVLSLRSRLLALHLIYIVLNTHLDVFANVLVRLQPTAQSIARHSEASETPGDSTPTSADPLSRPSLNDGPGAMDQTGETPESVTLPFIGVVKQYISLSLTRNLVSSDFSIFEVSLAILARLLVGLHKFVLKEIEVLFREIVLPTIDMRRMPHLQRSCLIQCLLEICNNSQTLIEFYLNYDCSQDSTLNLYERLVNTLSKIAAGYSGSGGTASTSTSGGPGGSTGSGANKGGQVTSNTGGGATRAGGPGSTGLEGPSYIVPSSMFLPHSPGDFGARTTIPPSLTTSAVTQALASQKESAIPDDFSLKCQSIEALTGILRSLVSWVNRGANEVQGGTSEAASPTPGEGSVETIPGEPNGNRPASTVTDESRGVTPPNGDMDHQLSRSASVMSSSSTTLAKHGLHAPTTDDPDQLMFFKQRKQQFEDGIRLFNWKPNKGIQALLDAGFIPSRDPEAIARFIRSTEGWNKAQLGEYLGEGDPENIAVMHAFVDQFTFTNMPFVTALREFLQDFRLPGESQKIDRFMLKFAERYVEGNPDVFANADTAYVLSYSVILLNTDLHSPQVKNRMTKADFVKNNRGINENADLPEEFLHAIYDEIQHDEIILKDEHDPLANAGNAGMGSHSLGGTSSTGETAGSGLTLALDVLRRRNSRYERLTSLSREMANKSEALIKDILRKRSRRDITNEINLFYQASHVAHVRPMFEIVWMPILAGISGPAQEMDDPYIICLCLESFRHAIHISVTFELTLARDAFVSTLAKFTVLADLMEMKPKNIEAIKTLLDIAAVDGNHLNKSWLDVLTCVSQLERLQLIHDPLGAGHGGGGGAMSLLVPSHPPTTPAGNAEAAGGHLGMTGAPPASPHRSSVISQTPSTGSTVSSERASSLLSGGRFTEKPIRRSVIVGGKSKLGTKHLNESLQLTNLSRLDAQSQTLVVAVDRIFSSSVRLSGTGIVEFVRALSEVSWEEIQNSTFGPHEQPRLYSLQKIVEISYYNMGRIRLEWSNIWAILGDHFNQVGCHPNVQVGFFALDSLRQLAMKFLEKEELAHFIFQKDFLRPFHFILENSPDVMIKDMVLRCVQHVIQSRSEQIRSGWKAILSTLASAARESSEPIVTMAFEILREVCRSRFNDIVTLGSFPELIYCLTEFCTSAQHQRSSLQAIEMLYLCAKNLASRLQSPLEGSGSHHVPTQPQAEVSGAGTELTEKSHPPVSFSGPTTTQTSPTVLTAAHSLPLADEPNRLFSPNEDPVYRLWLPIFHAMYDIIMNCDDLEVRTKALNYLFEFLKSNGGTFSFDFWSLILRDVVYPIFGDLKNSTEGKRFGRQEDFSIWFSTTLIKALRNLIDLFTFYYDVLCPTLDGILELLTLCITQESETLARIGTACFQELVEHNYQKFDTVAWKKICQTFLHLFNVSVPHVLFEMNGKTAALGDGLAGDRTSGLLNGNHSTRVTAKPCSWKGDPQVEYQRITLKCVLQLLLIQTVDELFHKNHTIYQTVDTDQLFFILDCLDKSYQFARKFNSDVQLRLALVESGFMTQVPSLLKQEVSSLQCSITILQRMYSDTTPERQLITEEVEGRLIPLSSNVLRHFNRIDPRTAEHHIQAWQPIVCNVLENIMEMDSKQTKCQLQILYPDILRLLNYPRPPGLMGLIQKMLLRVGEIYDVYDADEQEL